MVTLLTRLGSPIRCYYALRTTSDHCKGWMLNACGDDWLSKCWDRQLSTCVNASGLGGQVVVGLCRWLSLSALGVVCSMSCTNWMVSWLSCSSVGWPEFMVWSAVAGITGVDTGLVVFHPLGTRACSSRPWVRTVVRFLHFVSKNLCHNSDQKPFVHSWLVYRVSIYMTTF